MNGTSGLSVLALLERLTIVDLIMAVSGFGLVLALWIVVVILWRRHKGAQDEKIQQRLGLSGGTVTPGRTQVLRLWHEGKEVTTAVPVGTKRLSLAHRLESIRVEAGWTVPPRTVFVGLAGVATLVFVGAFVISGRALAGLAGAVAVVMIFWAYVKRRISRRDRLFELQFVSALDLATRSLRAGHPLTGACRLISEETAAPVGPLFAEICQNQEMGLSFEAALRQSASNTNSSDMKLFATSVAIQLHSGGNVADMMERLSYVIRDRMRLSRRVRVLTAQTQFSKRILAALPLLMFAVLNLLNPKYMEPLYTTMMGQFLLLIAGAGIVLGIWMMNRMAVLRF